MDIFDKIMRLPGLRIAEPWYKKNKEVLLYILFGGMTFVVSVASYSFFCLVYSMDELVANIISWIIAVTFAYITNKIWVFASNAKGIVEILKEAIKFYGGRVATLVVEEGLLLIFIEVLNCNSIVVKIVAQIVVIVLNYIISKVWVFKKQK